MELVDVDILEVLELILLCLSWVLVPGSYLFLQLVLKARTLVKDTTRLLLVKFIQVKQLKGALGRLEFSLFCGFVSFFKVVLN